MPAPSPIAPPASSPTAQANFNRLVQDIAWFGLGLPATMNFISVYAVRINANATVLGLLAALPAICALLTSSLARAWRKRYPDSVRALFWPGVGHRLTFLLPALTPFFPEAFQPYWLVLAISLPALPQGMANVLFLVLMRESVEPYRITALTSRRNMFFNLAVAAGTLSFGLWLDAVVFPLNYQVMYVVAFVLTMVSLWKVNQCVPITAEPPHPADEPDVNPWRDRAFQRVVLLVLVTHIPMFMIGPVVTLRLVEQMGASEGFMAYFALAGQITAAITAAMTNRVVQLVGYHSAMAIGMMLMAIMAAATALLPTLPPMIFASILGGCGWTLTAISIFGFFNQNMPQEHVTRYSTLWSQVTMLCVFIGPMLGSQLVNVGLGVVTVLLIGAGMRAVAAALIHAEKGKAARQIAE